MSSLLNISANSNKDIVDVGSLIIHVKNNLSFDIWNGELNKQPK